MNKKYLLSAVIAQTLSASVETAAASVAHDSMNSVNEDLFSMESLFSSENPAEAYAKSKSVGANIRQTAESIIEAMETGLANEGELVANEDAHSAKIAVAENLFGKAKVKELLGPDGDKFNEVDALLSQAGEVMAETMFALSAGDSAEKLVSTTYQEVQGVSMESIAGEDYDGFSLEHFDKFDPEKHVNVSMMLSAMSVVESPVVRINYPMYRLSPGQNVIELTIDQEYLIGNDVRPGKGEAFKKKDTPLIESYFNTDLWGDDRLENIPVYSDATKSFFVDKAITGLTDKTDELGNPFQTGYLAFGKNVDLISISADRGEIKGNIQDRTDQLDPAFNLRKLLLTVTNKAGDVTEPFAIRVDSYDTAGSSKDDVGGSRQFSINFHEERVHLPVTTKNVKDGSELSVLAALATAYAGGLAFEIQASFSKIDLTEATTKPMGQIAVTGAYTANGEFVPADDATLAPLLADVSFDMLGYDLNNRRTDTNFSNSGKEVELQSNTRRYKVGFSPRIQVRNPVNTSSLDEGRLLDSSLRKITREKVVNKLKAKFDLLMLHTNSGQGAVQSRETFPSAAFGNIVTVPTLRYKKITPTDDTLSRQHGERLDDVRKHTVGVLRTLITEATDESRLKTVAKDLNKGVEDIKVNITVDPRINQLLMVEGDDRMLTTAFKNFEIVEDEADFFKDKIVVTFSVDTPYEISPISNGIRAVGISPVVKFDPEQINGKKVAKTFAQPRELVLDTNDIMVVVEVAKLNEIMDVNKH